MELKRCKNGHSYDPSITPECPECAAQGGHTIPLTGVTPMGDWGEPDPIGKTQPVTGWLVCVKGVETGRDYRLHAEMNYIGRSKSNDVVFSSDPTVSRERHAVIAYDDREKMFFFAPANGSSLVRQNGRPVLSTAELKAGDRLEIGSGIYLFVPLCGEGFQW